MANDLNVVALTGRLTRDSELKYSQGGSAIARFTLASNRRVKGSDGNWNEEVSFFDCTMFGKRAEGVNQYLNKGQQVAINGELRQNRWEQDGQNRSKVEVIVLSITLIGSQGQGGSKSTRQSGDIYDPNTPIPSYSGPEDFDDSVPF